MMNPVTWIRSLSFKIRVLVFNKAGHNYPDWLKYDVKDKRWYLFNNGSVTDVTYLDISSEDIWSFEGKNYVLLVKKDEGKYQKLEIDFAKGSFTCLDIDIKVWEANTVRANAEQYKRMEHWWENPVIWSIGFSLAVVLFSLWFVMNYKEGGAIAGALTQIRDAILDIYNSLANVGIIQKIVDPLA